MRVLLMVLMSFSVLAVEELQQSVATTSNKPVTFALKSVNHNRGQYIHPTLGYFRIQASFDGLLQTGAVVRRYTPQGLLVTSMPEMPSRL